VLDACTGVGDSDEQPPRSRLGVSRRKGVLTGVDMRGMSSSDNSNNSRVEYMSCKPVTVIDAEGGALHSCGK
jgi:hypothetical protein